MAGKLTYRTVPWPVRPYLLALFCTLAILGIHMLPNMDSMLNENNTRISHVFLRSQIDYHKEIAPFARRPLTTFLMDGTAKVFRLKAGHAFILVNFSLLFLSGILLYRLSKNLKATPKQAIVNMLVYFSSFSILFAFFPPVFTYDEPLQYCFILAAFDAFVKRKWLWYLPMFTLALVTRETSLLLLPAIVLFFPGIDVSRGKSNFKEHLKSAALLLLPLLLYGIFIGIYVWKNQLMDATRTEMASRFSCFLENFDNTKNTVESLLSIFLTLGPFSYFALSYLKKHRPPLFFFFFVNAFWVTLAINTPVVILTAFARESRLFALPLLFIWPMFMQLFELETKPFFSFKSYGELFARWRCALPFIVLNSLNYWFCFSVYPGLGLGENTYFAEYLFLLNFYLISHLLLSSIGIPKKFGKTYNL